MFANKYERRLDAVIDTIDISDYVMRFLDELAKSESRRTTIRDESDAFRIKTLMDYRANTTPESMLELSSQPYWKYQKVSYVRSNLGDRRGFTFYFICEKCGRNAKRLYYHTYVAPPICRRCFGLPYPQSTRPMKKISRYLRRHPEAARQISESLSY